MCVTRRRARKEGKSCIEHINGKSRQEDKDATGAEASSVGGGVQASMTKHSVQRLHGGENGNLPYEREREQQERGQGLAECREKIEDIF